MRKAFFLIISLAAASQASAALWGVPVIIGRAVWSGEVEVREPVVVEESGELIVEGGAKVLFDIPHGDDHRPWVQVKGAVEILGTGESPVVFKAARDGSDEDDHDMFSILAAKRAVFSHATFSGAGWAVHLHEVPGASFKGCRFEGNYGGVRFKSDDLVFAGNRFTRNTIGVRAINSPNPVFTGNAFSGNQTGIFFREGVKGATLTGNSFDDEEYDIKLGEAQVFDVPAYENSFAGDVAEKIWDAADTPEIGRVLLKEER